MPATAGRTKRFRRSGHRALCCAFIRRSRSAGRRRRGGGKRRGPVARSISNACSDGACQHAGRSSFSQVDHSIILPLKRHPFRHWTLPLVMNLVDREVKYWHLG